MALMMMRCRCQTLLQLCLRNDKCHLMGWMMTAVLLLLPLALLLLLALLPVERGVYPRMAWAMKQVLHLPPSEDGTYQMMAWMTATESLHLAGGMSPVIS